MILTNDDIHEFEAALDKTLINDHYRENIHGAIFDGYEDEILLNQWISNNPQVLMAGAAFQEYVGAHELPLYKALVNNNFMPSIKHAGFRPYEGSWLLASVRASDQFGGSNEGVYGYSIEKLRQAIDENDDDIFDKAVYKIADIDEIIRKAKKHIDCGIIDPTTFVSPTLWTPDNQSKEKLIIQSAATPIIKAIQEEKCELGSLHWRQLEDIVAEILRQSGMEVHSVTESPQGGRDIIARAELVPGEVITIAVEVKHRKVVDRPILHTALHQNAHFPALMLVTSGRFTAGVIKEAKKPTNTLRLFLKDGVAIRDMIKNY